MKFQEIYDGIEEVTSQKSLNEALLTDIIDNWIYLVVNQYKYDNTTDPAEKKKYEKILNRFFDEDINIQTNVKWTGDLVKDFIEKIRNYNYQSSSFTIIGSEVEIIYGMNRVKVNYLTSPTAGKLIARIKEKLEQQSSKVNTSAQQAQSGQKPMQQTQQQAPVAQTPQATPVAANKVMNRLSTI